MNFDKQENAFSDIVVSIKIIEFKDNRLNNFFMIPPSFEKVLFLMHSFLSISITQDNDKKIKENAPKF